jgi:hypothetical protein
MDLHSPEQRQLLEENSRRFHQEVAQYQLEMHRTYGSIIEPLARAQLRRERDEFIAEKRLEMEQRNRSISISPLSPQPALRSPLSNVSQIREKKFDTPDDMDSKGPQPETMTEIPAPQLPTEVLTLTTSAMRALIELQRMNLQQWQQSMELLSDWQKFWNAWAFRSIFEHGTKDKSCAA